MKTSIVMATHNRRQLLINTLKTIEYYNVQRDIEVIVVDDNSSKEESILDIDKLFKIPVIIIPITAEEKNWKCCCMPFNIGFSFVTGDIVIIQNPENFHVGDIVGHAIANLNDNVFLSYALYSMNQRDSDNLIANTVKKNLLSGNDVKKAVGKFAGYVEKWNDGDTVWYNHSKYRPSGGHLISAITRSSLEDLNGFDERYGPGFAYDDMEFHERILRKGMKIKIIDDPFAIHQRHELARYNENRLAFMRNGELFSTVTKKEKIYRSPKNVFYNPNRSQPKHRLNDLLFCPITDSEDSIEFVDLGNVPLVNNLCATREESLAAERFPLSLQLFTKSRLTCLKFVVPKEGLFLNYFYRSGINKPYLDHCSDMYLFLEDFLELTSMDHVFDIGGNDGSLIEVFRQHNAWSIYTNIDASQSFIEINRSKKINYINQFFDESFKAKIAAKLIVSTNVFQHTLPIRSFVKGVYNNLDNKGIWCLEFPYLLTTFLNDNYDQIYHEHVYYYLLTNIVDLLKQEKMKVVHVSFHNIHSGTLRVLSVKEHNTMMPDQSVNSFLSLEKTLTDEYYIQWGARTVEKIEKFKTYINDLSRTGASIACFGAAAKGCVFLNTCGIDYNTVKFIVDDTPYKQGQFVPGTGLEVVGRAALKKTKIDYLIILAHNFKDYIINSLKSEYQGKYIIMFPDIKEI